ncbi:MAG: hypothetical protein AB8G11_07085 [Saprospiraceae bacterium]
MKKLVILFLIFINILTLYFFVFPYQSYSNYDSLAEVNRAFSIQKELISTSNEVTLNQLRRKVQAYPQFKSEEDLAKKIHTDCRYINIELNKLEEALYQRFGNYYSIPEYGKLPPNNFWFRVQPFHYQVPKSVLFNDENLAAAITIIGESQTAIIDSLKDEQLKQVYVDSFLIDTRALPQLLKGKSFLQTVSIINKLQTQIKMAEHEITSQLLENTKQKIVANQLRFQRFVPMVSVRKATVKKGELFEAEIFTTPIMTHDSLKFYINNQLVPSENGIVNYEFTPKSTRPKRFNVAVEIQNIFDTTSKRTYRKEFEIPVVNCE